MHLIFTLFDREPTLSSSKELRLLKAATALEDALYNFTRPVKTLRVELANPTKQARWQQRTPAMAAGLTDHIWTPRELLTTILIPQGMRQINLTVLSLYKVNTVKQNRPLLTHALIALLIALLISLFLPWAH